MLLDALHDYNLRAFPTLDTPKLKDPVVQGTPGVSTYKYKATFTTINGETIASEFVQTVVGPTTLNGVNKVFLQCKDVPAAAKTIKFFKYVAGSYYYLGSCAASVNGYYDIGTAVTNETPPLNNTSGRDDWMFMLYHPNRPLQRMEMMDQQGIDHILQKKFGDTLYKNGDITSGLAERQKVNVCTSLAGPFVISELSKYVKITVDNKTAVTLTLPIGGAVTVAQIVDVFKSWLPTVIAKEINGCLELSSFNKLAGFTFNTVADNAYTVLGFAVDQRVGPCLTWTIDPGTIYLEGKIVPVPGGEVTLTGVDTERIGVTVQDQVITYLEDPKLLNLDQNVSIETYSKPGADRLVFSFIWVKDLDGMITIKTFYRGMPKYVDSLIERSELEISLAERTYDSLGSFSVDDFPIAVKEYGSGDLLYENNLYLEIGKGKAYPFGYKVHTSTPIMVNLPRARTVHAASDYFMESINIVGGAVIGTVHDGTPYSLNAKSLTFWVYPYGNSELIPTTPTQPCPVPQGYGNYSVVFDQTHTTATLVVAKINELNSGRGNNFPIVDASVYTTGAGTQDEKHYVILKAANGYVLRLGNDAANATLGFAPPDGASYPYDFFPTGTYLYDAGVPFVRGVNDLDYVAETVTDTTSGVDRIVPPDSGLWQNDHKVGVCVGTNSKDRCIQNAFDYVQDTDFHVVNSVIVWDLSTPPPLAGTTYWVKFRFSRNAVRGVREYGYCSNATITRASSGSIDNIVFTGATSITKVSDGTSISVSGTAMDVIEVISVSSASNGGGVVYTNWAFNKNSGPLRHEASQIDWSGATSIDPAVPNGKPTAATSYYVNFYFWYHKTEGDYVAANSYDNYSKIELAPNSYWYLRDLVDYRTVNGVRPIVGATPIADLDCYIPRFDKLYLSETGEFYLASGTPAIIPKEPPDISHDLKLATIFVMPYTRDPEDVFLTEDKYPRYTQADINSMMNKLNNLEKFVSAFTGRNSAVDQAKEYGAKGFLNDALNTWKNCDAAYDKDDITFTAFIDTENRRLQLPYLAETYYIHVDTDASDGLKVVNGNKYATDEAGNKYYALDYEETVFHKQLFANEDCYINPDDVPTYNTGFMMLAPCVDIFTSTTQLPDRIVIDDSNKGLLQQQIDQYNSTEHITGYLGTYYKKAGNIRSATGLSYSANPKEFARRQAEQGYLTQMWNRTHAPQFQYPGTDPEGITPGWWENYYNVNAKIGNYNPVSFVAPGAQSGWGWAQGTSPGGYIGWYGEWQKEYMDYTINTKTLGMEYKEISNSVVNVSVAPMMREGITVTAFAQGVLQNSPFLVCVNSLRVDFLPATGYTAGADCVLSNIPVGSYDKDIADSPPLETKTVMSLSDRTVKGTFKMPRGIKAGTAIVQVMHATNTEMSAAIATFSSYDQLIKKQKTVMGFYTIQDKAVIKRGVETGNIKIIATNYIGYECPLAQTFYLKTDDDHPIFISGVDIYFSKPFTPPTEDPTADIPVKLEIREVVNGYPGSEGYATSYQTAVVKNSDINISSNSSTPTRFTFPNIVGYKTGWYCLVLTAEGTHHKVYISNRDGALDFITGEKVTPQADSGVLFHSPNNVTWMAYKDGACDLKFQLYKSNFKEACQVQFNNLTGIQAASFISKVSHMISSPATVKWLVSTTGGDSWDAYDENIETYLNTLGESILLRLDVSNSGAGAFQILEGIDGDGHKTNGLIIKKLGSAGDYIGLTNDMSSLSDKPNQIRAVLECVSDSINVANPTGTEFHLYYSIDSGDHWVKLTKDFDINNGLGRVTDIPYTQFEFFQGSTPPIDSFTGDIETQITVTVAEAVEYTDNAVILITATGCSLDNREFRIGDVTIVDQVSTFKLYDVDTDEAVKETVTGFSSGTFKLADMSSCKMMIRLASGDVVRTPFIQNLNVICS